MSAAGVNSTNLNPNRYKDGKFDPNDPYGGRRWVAYRYEPTMVGAAIFTVLFWLTTLYHLFQLYKGRVWYFIPFAIGGICKKPFLLFFSFFPDQFLSIDVFFL